MSFDSEPPTAPMNRGVVMTWGQVKSALESIPHDLQPLVIAMLRGMWDDGFLSGVAHGSRVSPLDRTAQLAKKKGKR